MRLKLIVISTISVIFFIKCSKDRDDTDGKDCSLRVPCLTGQNYIYKYPARYYPVFISNSEIVFFEKDYSELNLFKVNIYDPTKKTSLNNVFGSPCKLDFDGKELLIGTDLSWQIKIQSIISTDSKSFKFSPSDFAAKFNPSGDMFCFAKHQNYSNWDLERHPEWRLNYKIGISDLNGNVVDSFCRPVFHDVCYPWRICDWNGELFAAPLGPYWTNDDVSVYGLSLYDNNGNEVKRLETLGYEDNEIVDIIWDNNGNDVFASSLSGLKYYNVASAWKFRLNRHVLLNFTTVYQ